MADRFWTAYAHQQISFEYFMLPTTFVVLGALANWYWNKFHAHNVGEFPS